MAKAEIAALCLLVFMAESIPLLSANSLFAIWAGQSIDTVNMNQGRIFLAILSGAVRTLSLASSRDRAKQSAPSLSAGRSAMILTVLQPARLPASMSLSESPTIQDEDRSI